MLTFWPSVTMTFCCLTTGRRCRIRTAYRTTARIKTAVWGWTRYSVFCDISPWRPMTLGTGGELHVLSQTYPEGLQLPFFCYIPEVDWLKGADCRTKHRLLPKWFTIIIIEQKYILNLQKNCHICLIENKDEWKQRSHLNSYLNHKGNCLCSISYIATINM